MAQSHVVSGLLQKRSELMGLIEQKKKELAGLRQGLTSIDGAIILFDPDYDLRSVKETLIYSPALAQAAACF